jgi:hypothetical protein
LKSLPASGVISPKRVLSKLMNNHSFANSRALAHPKFGALPDALALSHICDAATWPQAQTAVGLASWERTFATAGSGPGLRVSGQA